MMAAPTIIECPDVTSDTTLGCEAWIVTVFNNEYNTWDEVVTILIAATGCTADEAEMETWEVDRLGRSVVHQGTNDECEGAAGIIGQIGIKVEVSQQ